jgi:hypothetical protein
MFIRCKRGRPGVQISGADKTQTFEFWPKEYGKKVICVKLTAKVLLFNATAKGQIICHPKNKSFLAEGDKNKWTKRQAGRFKKSGSRPRTGYGCQS